MAPAPLNPVNPCQPGCPWGRLGSVLYTCKRLHRMRRRFKHFGRFSQQTTAFRHGSRAGLASRALKGLGCRIDGVCVQATTHYQTTPSSPRSRSASKKVNNLGRWRPFPSKRSIPEGPQ